MLLLAGCSGGGPSPAPTTAPPERVQVRVGRAAPVTAEVADDDAERAVGLMRRTSVPPGTGMVFLYPEAHRGAYYMYDVPVPLTAVFARAGRVVLVVDMPPCRDAEPTACPTYGPQEPFDTVLETAPATLAGKVAVGDALTVVR